MGLLDNRVAIVTGGANGIGAGTCRMFVAEGARVVIADLEPAREAGEALAAELGAEHARFVAGDVSQKADCEATVAACREAFGSVTALVNNAGITRDGLIMRIKDGQRKALAEEKWDAVLGVNLKGSFLMVQAVVGALLEQQTPGTITSTASVAVRGNVGQVNYAASKAGIVGMTRTLALELARYKIRVNAIAPGATATRMFDAVPEKVKDQIVGAIPLRRMAEPEEIGRTHVFLHSDLASYVTGQLLYVDGGATIGI